MLFRSSPDLGELLKRIGARQVRASGTIGGNIANGSPIGDMPPALIALGAKLNLRHGKTSRTMNLEDFFISYGKQDQKPGELVWRIDIPKPKPNQTFKCAKITKRRDDDISAVMGAFLFTLENEKITAARIAYGGMAGTPSRALKTETALIGKSLHEAMNMTLGDYTPLSDMRASAEYRNYAANALLHKALMQAAGEKDLQVFA